MAVRAAEGRCLTLKLPTAAFGVWAWAVAGLSPAYGNLHPLLLTCCQPARCLPLQPITVMRNALGREEGGSGVPLDREAYEKATAYWDAHAQIQ